MQRSFASLTVAVTISLQSVAPEKEFYHFWPKVVENGQKCPKKKLLKSARRTKNALSGHIPTPPLNTPAQFLKMFSCTPPSFPQPHSCSSPKGPGGGGRSLKQRLSLTGPDIPPPVWIAVGLPFSCTLGLGGGLGSPPVCVFTLAGLGGGGLSGRPERSKGNRRQPEACKESKWGGLPTGRFTIPRPHLLCLCRCLSRGR